jgi:hypothetical protein
VSFINAYLIRRGKNMKETWVKNMGLGIVLAFLVIVPNLGWAKEAVQQWELVNPAGVMKSEPIKFVARSTSLEGKTVILRWNAKPNGDILLNRLGELLVQNVKGIKITEWGQA